PVRDQNLYCTTFPCHMCARHIVAAGLKQVVYIEPYPKSMAKKLYECEILVDAEVHGGAAGVRFIPFVGVAPKKLDNWFHAGQRKDGEGWALPAAGSVEQRKIARVVWTAPDEETTYIETLQKLGVFDEDGEWPANDLASENSRSGKEGASVAASGE